MIAKSFIHMFSRVTIAGCLLCLAGVRPGIAAADLSANASFNIAPQQLSGALLKYSQQAGVQVTSPTELIEGKATAGVVGTYPARKALDVLLRGTALGYDEIGSSTVTIRRAAVTQTGLSMSGGDSNSGDVSSKLQLASAPAEAGEVPPGRQQDSMVAKPPESDSSKSSVSLEEVVVTGSHIRGEEAVGSSLTVIDRNDIDRSGYSTIDQVVQSLPQAFGGGVQPGVVGASGQQNQLNNSGAASVNLRGLGSDSTLTLIDGHRLAPGGLSNVTDISIIPIAAVERVEILTDGASSIYGSDAVAGVANFILRKNFSGAQTSVTGGTSTQGGGTLWQVNQLLGTTWGGGGAMVSYQHRANDGLLLRQRDFAGTEQDPTSLLPTTSQDSVFANVRQDLSDWLHAYAQGLFTHRDSRLSNAFSGEQFFQDVTVLQYGVSSGLSADLPAGWSASLDGMVSGDNEEYVDADYAGANLASSSSSFFNNKEHGVEIGATGPIAHLPSGPANLAVGAGYRRESAAEPGTAYALNVDRDIYYGFAELLVPVISPDASRVGLEKLALDISGRTEHYSDAGSAFSPRVGLAYTPVEELNVHASWGRSFRAPSFFQEDSTHQLYLFPASYISTTLPANATYMLRYGGNAGLHPETARTYSAGLDFKPDWAPGFVVKLDGFDILYRQRIAQPLANTFAALTDPNYAPLVVAAPSASLQQGLIASSLFVNYAGSGYDPANVAYLLNDQYQNVSQQRARGMDLSASYHVQGAWGNLDITAAGTWFRLTQKLTSVSGNETLTGTVYNSPRFKMRDGVAWSKGPWSVASFVNFISSETEPVTETRVDSWMTWDAQVAWRLRTGRADDSGLRVSLSLQNLLDRRPPVIPDPGDSGITFDSANASALGRFMTFNLTQVW